MALSLPPLTFPIENKNSVLLRLFVTLIIFFVQTSLVPTVHGSDGIQPLSPAPPKLPTHRPMSRANRLLDRIRKTCNARVDTKNVTWATEDFGNITFYNPPLAVVHPLSLDAIQCVVKIASSAGIMVGAMGNRHSLDGQAEVPGGVVIKMDSLPNPLIHVDEKKLFVDFYPGLLWAQVLNKTLQYGLSPRSWTDYLYESAGGTLSNAGVSGQACRFGPQIDNVLEVDIVTGNGQNFTCSKHLNADLFNATLGGLGQFGIMTRVRVNLRKAPDAVNQVKVLYTDFSAFTMDQEYLTSGDQTFDYVEGFVLINTTQIPRQNVTTVYQIEAAQYFNQNDRNRSQRMLKNVLSKLNYIESTLDIQEFAYERFLDRVHIAQLKLEPLGLWRVPHPWLHLMVPKSTIHAFADGVLGKIIPDSSLNTIMIYPTKTKFWSNYTSVRAPEDDGYDMFYLVSFLQSAVPSPTGKNKNLELFQNQNRKVLDFCKKSNLQVKQYLASLKSTNEWKNEFGTRWEQFAMRKRAYDPEHILSPGQRIFNEL